MSVLIKGMEKPGSCGECQFCHTQLFGTWCCIMGREDIFFDAVPDWCPLVEVKEPHGRLVDADKLRTDIVECMEVKDPDHEWKEAEGLKEAIEYVEKAETVIEAKGTKE